MIKNFQKIVAYLKTEGFIRLFFAGILKLQNHRKRLAYRYIIGKGIEIGGLGNPLAVDKGKAEVKYVDYLPPEVLKTINEGIKDETPVTIDYLCKADNLVGIENNSQDFVIANHVFEHLDNPIKTLIEWNRVLKKGGIVFLTVPDKRRTFDRNRERTHIDHLILDYEKPSEERDFIHYKEFASVLLGSNLENEEKIEKEATRLKEIDYSIHYHVFLEEDVLEILEYGKKMKLFFLNPIEIKHTSWWNKADIEFIFILKK